MPQLHGFTAREWDCFEGILNAPTTSFHEDYVANEVMYWLDQFGCCGIEDEQGNILASTHTLKLGPSLPRALRLCEFIISAHMDHPGFEVVGWNNKRGVAMVELLGGVHRGQFNGAKVKIWSDDSYVKGKVRRYPQCGSPLEKHYRASMAVKLKRFEVKTDRPVSPGDFGHFDQPGCRVTNGIMSTKAADNLVNCALGIIVLKDLKKQFPRKKFGLVLTRAEEVGFVGLYGMLKNEVIPTATPWVVLEASQARKPVELGKGTVIRVGDRSTSFHPMMDHWLQRAAGIATRKNKDFCVQRALQQGGTCEASLLSFTDHLVGGLALPLANYHNVGRSSPAPEKIHMKDIHSMRQILRALPLAPQPVKNFKNSYKNLEMRIKPSLKRLRSRRRRFKC